MNHPLCFQYIPGRDKKQYEIQVGSIASKTYEIPVYKIDVPLDDILVNMDNAINPEGSGFLKKLWNKIFYNNLSEENHLSKRIGSYPISRISEI